MAHGKEVRWKQRFENFEKAYLVLQENVTHPIKTDLERAGLVQLFEVTFELSWKVLKDYLEAEGFSVKSPRETLKQAFQIGLIEEGHPWMDALADRNLTAHTYNDALADKLVKEIKESYFPMIEQLYHKLSKER
ncbi:nucleotidyltransferase substrate binding protein [Thalassobacillus pellis]|uniref:nucleotidyltransferase substrate binding protein n=1 Tax=Thalassobacillus pellis TaxID=748008 RepID=UPI001960612D|nr:nucleotidyltransferase substrate binding protein [Thalassobacillus pellis]MBM7554488.1 nucleotidyltransferase substrate binding protein (TIGR01987 family) [Thalassobacillus pellis]